jgi:hypothetical protein
MKAAVLALLLVLLLCGGGGGSSLTSVIGKDVALTLEAGVHGSSSISFQVQQRLPFVLVSSDGALELGTGNTSLLKIVGPSAASTVSTPTTNASAAIRRESAAMYDRLRDVAGVGKNLAGGGASRLATNISLLGTLDVTGAVATAPSGLLQVFGVPQWKMVVFEDFAEGVARGWSNRGAQSPLPINNGVSICSVHPTPSSDYFLGAFQAVETTKSFAMPVHSRVQLRFRAHFIDRWEGESLFVRVDGAVVYARAHNWCAADKVLVEPCLAQQAPGDTRYVADLSAVSSCSCPYNVVVVHYWKECPRHAV